jgi:hypothetical protein
MSGKIFINYRRGDDPGNTGRLFDQLQDVFPRDRLFMDVDSIPPGRDFVRVLDEQVAQSDVLLAVIGKGWLDARDQHGVRRLDKPDDFVRIEIESALKQNKLGSRCWCMTRGCRARMSCRQIRAARETRCSADARTVQI